MCSVRLAGQHFQLLPEARLVTVWGPVGCQLAQQGVGEPALAFEPPRHVEVAAAERVLFKRQQRVVVLLD